MVHAHHVAGRLDVVGHILDADCGARALLAGGDPLVHGGGHESGHCGDHLHAVVVGEHALHVLGHVARMRVDGEARGVAEHDRQLRCGERVAHRVGGDVGQVDDHADVVHLGHDLAATVVQAVPLVLPTAASANSLVLF